MNPRQSKLPGDGDLRNRYVKWALSERAALGAFVTYLAVAFPLILFRLGKDEWFVHDDWNLLVGSVTPSVFTPVEQHWSTLPILIYRLLFHLFGANYFPFLATVSVLHLGIVVLLRTVMRRAGVDKWLATLTAALLVLFGPGYMSIVFSIEITQNLSIVLGLAQMILADRDGVMTKEDWAGLFLGALNVMCSGLAPILVIGVGVATLLRRGWRIAAFHTVPLGALFLLWFSQQPGLREADTYRLPYRQSHPLDFAIDGLWASVRALGHYDAIALVMGAILLGGLALKLASKPTGSSAERAWTPIALLLCVPVYFAILGLQRSRLGSSYTVYSHHLYTAVCLALPAFACAADAIVGRWKATAPLVVALELAVIPLNLDGFTAREGRTLANSTSFTRQNMDLLLAIAHSPYASSALHLDPGKHTNPWYTPNLKLGWVLEQGRNGRLPHPGAPDAALDEQVQLFYGLTDLGPPATSECRELALPVEVNPEAGDLIGFGSAVTVVNVRNDPASTATISFQWPPRAGHVLRVELPGMRLRLRSPSKEAPLIYCGPDVLPPAPPIDAADALRRAIQSDPDAMDAFKKAILKDPKAMEALRKAMQNGTAK